MPRANRHFVPGYIWHITHRCHKKSYLLKYKVDKSYCTKLLADVKDPLGGSLSSQTRNAITELVNAWQADLNISDIIDCYINTLQGDNLSRLANIQPTFNG